LIMGSISGRAFISVNVFTTLPQAEAHCQSARVAQHSFDPRTFALCAQLVRYCASPLSAMPNARSPSATASVQVSSPPCLANCPQAQGSRSKSYCFLVAITRNLESPSAETLLIHLSNKPTAERFEIAIFVKRAAKAFREFRNNYRGVFASVAQR
jgi:hypothetical protein